MSPLAFFVTVIALIWLAWILFDLFFLAGKWPSWVMPSLIISVSWLITAFTFREVL